MKALPTAAFALSLLLHVPLFILTARTPAAKKTPPSIIVSRVEFSSPEPGEGEAASPGGEASSGDAGKMDVPRDRPPPAERNVALDAPSVEYEERCEIGWKSAPLPPPARGAAKTSREQARVDVPPSVEKTVKPKYPRGARRRGEEGDVTLEVLIAAEGAVKDVRIVESSGFRELDEAAVSAAKASRFSPARAGGAEVESQARITLSFRLR